ncbi:hypothetical protein L226DRAFT_562618 [Lentinus tigrinus ALCF2SS1-7]|uniref:uncharacterized protein n=1 Tax=Lentinus tigrinus ALCF2SS1-7 TaxID=1328758 RepID=UPI001165D873|nr:hypothetical protein L226DRAFT_562618 [Lentinus tigrinus ALCF2SS1-7]
MAKPKATHECYCNELCGGVWRPVTKKQYREHSKYRNKGLIEALRRLKQIMDEESNGGQGSSGMNRMSAAGRGTEGKTNPPRADSDGASGAPATVSRRSTMQSFPLGQHVPSRSNQPYPAPFFTVPVSQSRASPVISGPEPDGSARASHTSPPSISAPPTTISSLPSIATLSTTEPAGLSMTHPDDAGDHHNHPRQRAPRSAGAWPPNDDMQTAKWYYARQWYAATSGTLKDFEVHFKSLSKEEKQKQRNDYARLKKKSRLRVRTCPLSTVPSLSL